MPTQKQINANRQNATKSTGPKSAEGKRLVSQNAVTHGLFSSKVIMADEDHETYGMLLQALVEEFEPQTAIECSLVEKLAVSLWRDRRLAHTESHMVENHNRRFGDNDSPSGFVPIMKMDLFARYQRLISNEIFKVLEELRKHREYRLRGSPMEF